MARADLFDTARPAVAALWDRFLALQADVCFETERRLLTGSAAWQRARTVADLGTGNGAWLARLAAAWPDKEYTGVERSAELVRLARERHAGANLRFVEADLSALDGRWDVLVLRAVLQHVAAPERLAAALRERLAEGGSLLVLDNDPAAARTWPPAPRAAALYAEFARRQRAGGGAATDALGAFARAAAADPGLAVAVDRVVLVPSTLPGNAARFQEQTLTALQLFRETGAVTGDVAAAIEEWRAWCALPQTYIQIGVRFVQVDRVAARPAGGAGRR